MLRSPTFTPCYRDNTPVVGLGMWSLEAEYFDNDVMSGVVPTLYSDDPEASERAILADQARAKKDLESLNRVFFVPETVTLDSAIKITKKPRLGDADYSFKTRNLERLQELSQIGKTD